MRFYNYAMITAGDMSGDITSGAIPLENVYGYAVQAVITGGPPTGSFLIQGSCDESHDNNAVLGDGITNWTTVSTTAVSAAGTILINNDGIHYKWMRIKYTFTAGTGSLTVRVNTKGV